MTVSFGAHVDQDDPVAAAMALGASLSQFFLGDPQGWKAPTVAYAAGAEALKADAAAAGIDLYVHAPYVLNVATTNNRVRIPSRQLLQKQVTLATAIGAKGIIVHGGHVGNEDDLGIGFDNWRKCIDGLDITLPLLIENTAGGTGAIARRLDRIDQLWSTIQSASGVEDVGFCLDTCHAHAGGIELAGLVDKVMAITGRIDVVHANDSRDPFDSGADRHADLGTGLCDPEGLAEVIGTAGAPIVFETPGAKQGHEGDIRWVAENVR
jgi:deoxyribonuclease IV